MLIEIGQIQRKSSSYDLAKTAQGNRRWGSQSPPRPPCHALIKQLLANCKSQFQILKQELLSRLVQFLVYSFGSDGTLHVMLMDAWGDSGIQSPPFFTLFWL